MYSIFQSCCKSRPRVVQSFKSINSNLSSKSYLSSCNLIRKFSSKKDSEDSAYSGQFKNFKNNESHIIFDVDEEKQLAMNNPDYLKLYQPESEETPDEFESFNLERGITGVYDIEELVEVLKKQRAQKICVISIPPEHRYVDFIAIVTGKSFKHMYAIAYFVRRLYKKKYDPDRGDTIPKIEGEDSQDWMALDLGNIALHIFSPKAREKYDLESLWCLGKDLDSRSNEEVNELLSILESHSIELGRLTPNEDDNDDIDKNK